MKKLALEESRDPGYNKTCSHISAEESAQRAADGDEHCIRFKSGSVAPLVQDLVYGTYKSPVPPDDFIIIKRDGFPTYHFANVVDDHLMEITHVIRGAEWLISTPRHVALYDAFGWETPQFAHVGLLVDQKKQKLSKRSGGFNLSSWKEQGILPIALLNYVLLLGWSPSRDSDEKSEIMDMSDMIQKFHLRFTKGDITVNSKSDFLQKAHVRKSLSESGDRESVLASILPTLSNAILQYNESRASQEDPKAPHKDLGVRLGQLVRPARSLEASGEDPPTISQSYLKALLDLDGKSYTTPLEYVKRNAYLLWEIPKEEHIARLQEQQYIWDKMAVQEGNGREARLHWLSISEIAGKLIDALLDIPAADWTEQKIKHTIEPLLKSINHVDKERILPWGWKFLRWVVSASAPGPAVVSSMVLIGKDETVSRARQTFRVARRMKA